VRKMIEKSFADDKLKVMGRRSEKGFKFEEALSELEKIVSRLDSGDLGLDEMLREFERGVSLVRGCKEFLDKAQKKVEMLIKEDGKIGLKELKEESLEDEDEDEEGEDEEN